MSRNNNYQKYEDATPFERLKHRATKHNHRIAKQTENLLEELTQKVKDLSNKCLIQAKIINRLAHLASKEELAKLRAELDAVGSADANQN